MRIVHEVVTVAAAGTPVALAEVTEHRAWAISVVPLWTNTDPVYVGLAGMVKGTGVKVIRKLLPATEVPFEWGIPTGQTFDVREFRFDADANGQKLLVTYLIA